MVEYCTMENQLTLIMDRSVEDGVDRSSALDDSA